MAIFTTKYLPPQKKYKLIIAQQLAKVKKLILSLINLLIQ